MSEDKSVKPFPERKQNFARKQAELGKGIFAGQEPQGTGPSNRHGMPQLPVGQREVKNWPVLDLGDVPEISTASFRLDVDGLCAAPRSYDFAAFMALPQSEDVSDFHCVTTWSRMDNRWGGVRFADLAAASRPAPEARFVLVTACDVAPGTDVPYTTNLSLAEAM